MFVMRLILSIFFLFIVQPANAERLALVIGNADFQRSTDLPQSAADANAMANKLKSLDFRLIGGDAHVNLNRSEMLLKVRELSSDAEEGDEIVFYFSGHGIGGEQTNYLLPTDDQFIETKEDLSDFAIDVASILDRLPKGGKGVNIFILDACRDNPLPSRAKSASLEKGLVSIMAGSSNTVFLYAAEPGQKAYVSENGYSFFTDALIDALSQPQQNLTDILRKVRAQVVSETQKMPAPQFPWMEGFPNEPFYFNENAELAAWQSAQSADTVASYVDYLNEYPVGSFDIEAVVAMQDLLSARKNIPERVSNNPSSTTECEDANFRAVVFFEFDRSLLTTQSQRDLDLIAEFIAKLTDECTLSSIQLFAHTESGMSQAYSVNVSDRLGRTVNDYLAYRGVPLDRVIAVANGAELPLSPCTTTNPNVHILNRRVEVEVKFQS